MSLSEQLFFMNETFGTSTTVSQLYPINYGNYSNTILSAFTPSSSLSSAMLSSGTSTIPTPTTILSTSSSLASSISSTSITSSTNLTYENFTNDLIENSYLQNVSEPIRKDYVFDRIDVRVIFITLYSLVFCCCFFGNLLVIVVVTMSRRLRSITNFFLANLAVADFCVGVFCVMQNLTIYLIDSWVFGEFLCKMYQFVHSLSYTASIFILVVICMERYFAIIHPITCKQILTPTRLRLVIVGVWVTSAVFSTPKFIFSRTITNVHTINGMNEEICILNRKLFNSKLLDNINFGLLYVLPLLVMTILYSRIAVALWKSSQGLSRHIPMQNTSASPPATVNNHLQRNSSTKYEKRVVGVTESQVSVESDKVVVSTWRGQSQHHRHNNQMAQLSHSSNNVLRARRGVIRMLIIVVLTFALCNLPIHARKLWQYWSYNYKGDSNFTALFTPLTFLVSYFNSGVNPLLYAFLSRNFRKGMRELLFCSLKKNKNKSIAAQRIPTHNHSLPTDTTHIGNPL